jgi:hypothetical protein
VHVCDIHVYTRMIHISICTQTFVCIHVCVHIHVCIFIYTVHTHINISIHICVPMCTCVQTYPSMHPKKRFIKLMQFKFAVLSR